MTMTTPGGTGVAVAVARLRLVVAVSILALPLAVGAQPTGKVSRIGYLGNSSAQVSYIEAFRDGLRELGWIEGQNVAIDYRFAEGRFERLPDLAAVLVRLRSTSS